MTNLNQYMGNIISSMNTPHDTFQRNTLRAASFNLCLSKHALGFALIWAISATSIAFAGDVTTSTYGTVAVKVVKPETAIPLKLSKPLMSPQGAAPSTIHPVQIAFGTSIVGKQPTAVVIERVTSSGDKILEETVLRDDGNKPDAIAGDGFYSGTLDLGIQNEETEIYFRLRSEYGDSEYSKKTVTSDIALFPITTFHLGSSPSAGHLIYSANDRAEFFAGEVVVEPHPGVTPRRFREIVAGISQPVKTGYKNPDKKDRNRGQQQDNTTDTFTHDKSGSTPRSFSIKGYIPSLNAYLVAFEGDGTFPFQAINRVIRSFSASEEVKYASPNSKFTPAAPHQWYLKKDTHGINREDLDKNFPKYGPPGRGVGVAIIDIDINCLGIGKSSCRFLTPPASTNSCYKYSYNSVGSSSTNHHGTTVAKLTAGASTGAADFAGVAPEITLYPVQLKSDDNFTLSEAITCAGTIAAQYGERIHILNISLAANDDDPLKAAVCSAVCADQLIVASAGGKIKHEGSCIPKDLGVFPADYSIKPADDSPATCSCGKMLYDSVLSVGGTDKEGKLGVGSQSTFKKCSFPGNVRAPGWYIPGAGKQSDENFGTSWSAPLVSGCAAVRAADQIARNRGWNPRRLKNQLITHSREASNPRKPKPLNCFSAVDDPNADPEQNPDPKPDPNL